MIGYGKAPVQIVPNTDIGMPGWLLRDPLTTYPAPGPFQQSFTPRDCIFSYYQSYGWIRRFYPEAGNQIIAWWAANKGNDQVLADSELFDLCEYVDANEYVLCLVGKRRHDWEGSFGGNELPSMELSRTENRAGVCPVVAPGRINIDRTHSDYIDLYGMYIMRAKLQALDYINTEKNVFAERWVEDLPSVPGGSEVRVHANAKEGVVGEISGGQIRDLPQPPNIYVGQMLDRLEQDERVRSAMPAEMGGERQPATFAPRRGGQAISQAAVNFTIQETQEIFEESKRHENEIAIAFDLAYFNHPKSYFVGWKTQRMKEVDYTPGDIWENSTNFVAYSAAGADMNNLGIAGSQRIAQKTMSLRTFQEMDPMVNDPEVEHERVISEQLEQSILVELLQPGSMAATDKARIAELVAGGKTLIEGINQAQKEAQAKQAQVQAPGEPPEAAGAPPGTAGAQPGLQPGVPGQQPGQEIPGPSPDQQGLATLLRSLTAPGRAGNAMNQTQAPPGQGAMTPA